MLMGSVSSMISMVYELPSAVSEGGVYVYAPLFGIFAIEFLN